MQAPDVIETPRLLLRPPRRSDAEAIFNRYAADVEVTRYLSWPRHRTIDHTQAFLDFSEAQWSNQPAGPYLIHSHDGDLLGSTGLTFQAPHRAETGCLLARDAWGNGYATEALQAMVSLAAELGIQRLSALCHPGNRASACVLERGGFQLEGTLRRYLVFPNLQTTAASDVLCYSRIADPST